MDNIVYAQMQSVIVGLMSRITHLEMETQEDLDVMWKKLNRLEDQLDAHLMMHEAKEDFEKRVKSLKETP